MKTIYRLEDVGIAELDAMKKIVNDPELCDNNAYIGFDKKGCYTNCPMIAQNHQESGKKVIIVAKKCKSE